MARGLCLVPVLLGGSARPWLGSLPVAEAAASDCITTMLQPAARRLQLLCVCVCHCHCRPSRQRVEVQGRLPGLLAYNDSTVPSNRVGLDCTPVGPLTVRH